MTEPHANRRLMQGMNNPGAQMYAGDYVLLSMVHNEQQLETVLRVFAHFGYVYTGLYKNLRKKDAKYLGIDNEGYLIVCNHWNQFGVREEMLACFEVSNMLEWAAKNLPNKPKPNEPDLFWEPCPHAGGGAQKQEALDHGFMPLLDAGVISRATLPSPYTVKTAHRARTALALYKPLAKLLNATALDPVKAVNVQVYPVWGQGIKITFMLPMVENDAKTLQAITEAVKSMGTTIAQAPEVEGDKRWDL